MGLTVSEGESMALMPGSKAAQSDLVLEQWLEQWSHRRHREREVGERRERQRDEERQRQRWRQQ